MRKTACDQHAPLALVFFVIAIAILFEFTALRLREIKRITVNLIGINKTRCEVRHSALPCHNIKNIICISHAVMDTPVPIRW